MQKSSSKTSKQSDAASRPSSSAKNWDLVDRGFDELYPVLVQYVVDELQKFYRDGGKDEWWVRGVAPFLSEKQESEARGTYTESSPMSSDYGKDADWHQGVEPYLGPQQLRERQKAKTDVVSIDDIDLDGALCILDESPDGVFRKLTSDCHAWVKKLREARESEAEAQGGAGGLQGQRSL